MPELRDLVELPDGRQASYEVIGEGQPARYFQGGPGFSASLLRDDAELLGDRFAVHLARHSEAPWFPGAEETWNTWTERILAATDPHEADEMMALVLPLYTAHPDRPGVVRMMEVFRRDARSNLDAMKVWESGLYQRIDIRPLLADVRAPTLVLTGELDLICGPTHARQLAEAIPHATVEIIPDCGHMIPAEAPVEFKQAVEAFAS